MATIKECTLKIYNENIDLASTNGALFRKTVIEKVIAETNCSLATASTNYNIIKKSNPVEGLGRPVSESEYIENNCFTVLELLDDKDYTVGRCYSFLMQGDASECFDNKIYNSKSKWVMIKGLGPNNGELYKLESNEYEIKKYG